MAESTTNQQQERLLAQMGWVRALAHRLVSDPGLADDVAQDAWLAARSAPPQLEGEGAERAWLGTVVRNLIGKSARSRSRQRQRELVAAQTEEQASTADLVERGAMHRELTGCVMALDEPYRSAVLMRYLDGLTAVDIARRQAISPAAARKRLSRANEQLRDMLDDSRGGQRRAWSVPMVALARTTSEAKLNTTLYKFSALLGFIMAKKFIVAALLLAAISILAMRPWENAPSPSDLGYTGAPAPIETANLEPVPSAGPDPLGPEAEARVAAEPVGAPGETTPKVDSRNGWIVTLIDDSGEAVEGANVDLVVQMQFGDMRVGKKLLIAGPTDSAGRVFVEDVLATTPGLTWEDTEKEVAEVQLVPAGLFGASPKSDLAGAAGPENPAVPVTPGENSPPTEVALALPECGSARIDVESTAAALPEGFSVYLSEGVDSYMTGSIVSRPLPAGKRTASVTFEGIGLRRELTAELRSSSGATLGTCTLSGPKAKGQCVTGKIDLVTSPTTLRGRVLGAANQRLTIGLRAKPSASHTLSVKRKQVVAQVTANDRGEFEVAAPWLTFPRAVFAQLYVHGQDATEHAYEPNVLVAPDSPIVELGEFELGPIPVAIGGRLVDEQGRGVVAKLNVEVKPDPASGVHWNRFVGTIESATDGSFALTGQFPGGEVQLLLESGTHAFPGGEGAIVALPVGTSDAEIVANENGWLQVNDSWLPDGFRSQFHLLIHRSDLDEEGTRASRQTFVLGRGARIGPVGSGPLRVELKGWGVGTVGSWDILVPAGETYDFGAMAPDRTLHTHVVIIDTEEVTIDPPPRVMGRGAHRTFAGNADFTGRRHTFLTTEPIQAVYVGHDHGEGAAGDAEEHLVTGSETHLSLE